MRLTIDLYNLQCYASQYIHWCQFALEMIEKRPKKNINEYIAKPARVQNRIWLE